MNNLVQNDTGLDRSRKYLPLVGIEHHPHQPDHFFVGTVSRHFEHGGGYARFGAFGRHEPVWMLDSHAAFPALVVRVVSVNEYSRLLVPVADPVGIPLAGI